MELIDRPAVEDQPDPPLLVSGVLLVNEEGSDITAALCAVGDEAHQRQPLNKLPPFAARLCEGGVPNVV